MPLSRSVYRVTQFWKALFARPKASDLAWASEILSGTQYALFRQMQLSEQAHAVDVCAQLKAQGYQDPDLLAAALLHDVGKSKAPLWVWERAWVVLGKKFLPERVENWGQGEPRGWRKAFVVAAKHPAWGAELAEDIGTSPLVVKLIRFHQADAQEELTEEQMKLLAALQAVDDQS